MREALGAGHGASRRRDAAASMCGCIEGEGPQGRPPFARLSAVPHPPLLSSPPVNCVAYGLISVCSAVVSIWRGEP